MPTEPHKILLDRDFYSVLIMQQFSESLELLEALVNYGSNIVPRCFESSEKKLHDVVILLNFLKQGVSLLDSIHILSARGATTPCFISLRSLFEISVYLEWIFQRDTVNFDNKYINEWRSRFFSVKAVKYENGIYTIGDNKLLKLASAAAQVFFCKML